MNVRQTRVIDFFPARRQADRNSIKDISEKSTPARNVIQKSACSKLSVGKTPTTLLKYCRINTPEVCPETPKDVPVEIPCSSTNPSDKVVDAPATPTVVATNSNDSAAVAKSQDISFKSGYSTPKKTPASTGQSVKNTNEKTPVKATPAFRADFPNGAGSQKRPAQTSVFASPVKSQIAIPSKPCTSTTPAKRVAFVDLGDAEQNFELPLMYKFLLNAFLGTDQIVAMAYRRRDSTSFSKLKDGVQNLTRRTFELRNLGQIKTIYPEAYFFEQRRLMTPCARRAKSEEHELFIKPNLDTDLSTYGIASPKKTPQKLLLMSPVKSPPTTPVKRVRYGMSPARTPTRIRNTEPIVTETCSPCEAVFTGQRQTIRGRVFQRNLLEILRESHKAYLASLTPPIILTDEEEANLKRWHDGFLLEKDFIKEIEPSPLPRPPIIEKFATAKEMLQMARVKTPTKTEKEQSSDSNSNSNDELPTLPASLKKLPVALLEKIRAKERQKKLAAMTRSSEEEKRRLMLLRLPEFVRIIKSCFAIISRNTQPVTELVDRLKNSHKSQLTIGDIDEHMKLLKDLFPTWISQIDIRGRGSFIKINPEFDILAAVMEHCKSIS